MLPTLLLLAAAVALGAMAQRATGIGFSLVVAPACAIAVIPDASIGTLVRLALIADVAVLISERSSIDWRSVRPLLVPAAVAVPIGLVVGALVPGEVMVTATAVATIGAAALLILTSSRATPAPTPAPTPALLPAARAGGSADGRPDATARAAGFAAGFMGVTTGMPGPPLALHASRAHGPLAGDRASMVVLFLVIDLVAVVSHPRSLPLDQLGLLAVAILSGLGGGAWLTRRVADRHLRVALLVIVAAGACAGFAHVVS